jgi:hypothetical protein
MFGSTIGKRMLLSGGANILGQLSQEGNEGDINLLSAGLGALTGAMTTPGADFSGMTTKGTLADQGIIGSQARTEMANRTLLTKAKDLGLEGLAKGADLLRPGGSVPELFSKEGAKAALLPAATATGDVMQAQARQLEKQAAIDAALAEAEALADSGARAQAIRNAMNTYGFFTDEEIEDTISSAGYKAGGRVGFDNGGGLFSFLSPDEGRDTFSINEAVAENMQIGKLPYETTSMILELNRDGKSVEEISEITGIDISDVGEMLSVANRDLPIDVGDSLNKMLAQNVEIQDRPSNLSYKAKGGRVGAEEGGLMNLGGKEMDMRPGGFIPIGKKEKADDVPARLSKNEFVMTADAVRAAGGGSVNKGAKRMYNLMNTLEAKA